MNIGNRPSQILQVSYDEKKLNSKLKEWICLQSHTERSLTHDCVINSFHFLDIIKDRNLAESLAENLNVRMYGMSEPEILKTLFEFLGNQHGIREYIVNKNNNYKDWIDVLKSELKPNNLTVGLFKYHPDSMDFVEGHAVIIYNDKNGIIHIFDSQQLITVSSEKKIIEYLNKYYAMYLISSPYKRKASDITLRIRKRKHSNSPPLKKNRRNTKEIKSNSAMSISTKKRKASTKKRKASTSTRKASTKKRKASDITLRIRKRKHSNSPPLKKTRRNTKEIKSNSAMSISPPSNK